MKGGELCSITAGGVASTAATADIQATGGIDQCCVAEVRCASNMPHSQPLRCELSPVPRPHTHGGADLCCLAAHRSPSLGLGLIQAYTCQTLLPLMKDLEDAIGAYEAAS